MTANESANLRLRAEDVSDLNIIATLLEAAITNAADISYQPDMRSFVAMFNRFQWESDGKLPFRTGGRRIRSALRFDFVDKVRLSGIRPGAKNHVLELLTIESESVGETGAVITLVFAGDYKVRIDVECVECTLDDIGMAWMTPHRPNHPKEA